MGIDTARYLLLSDLLARPDLLEPPAVVVPRFAWEGRVSMLAGEEKSGKSTLAGQATAALSCGLSFLGESVAPRPVVWLALDEPLGDLVRRLDRFGARAGVAILTERPDPMTLRDVVSELGAGLVVVDTLTEFAAGLVQDLNDAAQWTGQLRTLRLVAQETSAAVLVLHHTNRANGRYRGSSQIGAGVDAILELSSDPGDEMLRKVRSRGRLVCESFRMRFTQGRGYAMDGGALTVEDRVREVIAGNPGITTRRLRELVSARAAEVDSAVAALLRIGAIQDDGSGTRHSYRTRSGHALDRGPSGHAPDTGRDTLWDTVPG